MLKKNKFFKRIILAKSAFLWFSIFWQINQVPLILSNYLYSSVLKFVPQISSPNTPAIKFPIFFSLQTLVITALYKHCTTINFENFPRMAPSQWTTTNISAGMGKLSLINLLEVSFFFIKIYIIQLKTYLRLRLWIIHLCWPLSPSVLHKITPTSLSVGLIFQEFQTCFYSKYSMIDENIRHYPSNISICDPLTGVYFYQKFKFFQKWLFVVWI